MPVKGRPPHGAQPKTSQLALFHFKDWSQLTIPPQQGRKSSHHSTQGLYPIHTPSRNHTSPGHRQPTEPAHFTRGNKPLAKPHHWPLLVHNAQPYMGHSSWDFHYYYAPKRAPLSPKTFELVMLTDHPTVMNTGR